MLIPLKLVRDQRLQQQLYEQLRELIVSKRLSPGARMPSTRMMAEQFSVSRITVLLTYERLVAEGYLRTSPARGTFVAPATERPGAAAPAAPYDCLLSQGTATPPMAGCPDPALFPAQRWRTLMRGALDRLGAQPAVDDPAGHPALRSAIANWLSTSRGLAVTADEVIITRGRQQALHLVAHLALTPGARTVVETPCDASASAILVAERGDLARIPVDADGIRTCDLPELSTALIHVTPEHQRPLGTQMSLDRRHDLISWAARSGALILEEDFEGEIRYGDMALPPLKALDHSDRTILIGGFRVSLGPWIDLSYVIPPRRLTAAAINALRLMDDSRGGLEQVALAEFMDSGGYALHLHRLTKSYASRRDALTTALSRHFGPAAGVTGDHAGLHLAWFPPASAGEVEQLRPLALKCGLEAATLAVDPRARLAGGRALLLGFGRLPEKQLHARVARLAILAREAMAEAAQTAV
jgi:GntR family transcriptional regulator / MocR family aminotransferase